MMDSKIHMKPPTRESLDIPQFVLDIVRRLYNAGFTAYIVGGALRDFYINHPVNDWDMATSAFPDQIISLFHDMRHFCLKHETVTLVHNRKQYEITSLRKGKGEIQSIEADLGERDFTINALAVAIGKDTIIRVIDPFNGREDIRKKVIRAVGNPSDRFYADPLRLIRAVRFASELGFRIEESTKERIIGLSESILTVAKERMRNEFMKILMTEQPSHGIELLRNTGLLRHILPELLEGYGMEQNAYHRFTVYEHTLQTLDRTEQDIILRLAALFHDIAKPRVRKEVTGMIRFIGHEQAGAALSSHILQRLTIDNKTNYVVMNLIRNHMIQYSTSWSDGSVRRLIRNAGLENMRHLIALRRADLLAHGGRDEKIDFLNHLAARIQCLTDNDMALSRTALMVNGKDVMKMLHIPSGPEVGRILDLLTEKVLDCPALNTKERLMALLQEMRTH